ncbi:MAG: hypothetical protein L0215_05750 [Gemmataceae bacterium]|nr:hypothetical protein [Gemmataceae bacterium]
MAEVRCERYGVSWLSPTVIAPAVSQEVASLLRSGNPIAAIRRLREETGLGLPDAKAVALHVTREPGKCQRCGAALAAVAAVVCPNSRLGTYHRETPFRRTPKNQSGGIAPHSKGARGETAIPAIAAAVAST